MTGAVETAFEPPVSHFDALGPLSELASRLEGGVVDLSIGTPCDPPAPRVVEALSQSGAERGYPTATGSSVYREAAASWIERRFAVRLDPAHEVAACVGTKEFVVGAPHLLRLRTPSRDTVLRPALAYPSYEMGAVLAGCRPVAVPQKADGSMDLDAVSSEDRERALCLWVNSPGNPGGQLEDFGAVAEWGRQNGIVVLSDECYVEFTWSKAPSSILEHGTDGVVAVHSLSKRSNLAGIRAGVYAGDAELVSYLAAMRRHIGLIVAGPVQHAGAIAFSDDESVAAQRERYRERLEFLASALTAVGIPAFMPRGSFYLFVEAPGFVEAHGGETRGEALARLLAGRGGILASPGAAYGPAGRDYVRLAAVQPIERLRLAADRLSSG